jgi:hypothetical protein
MAGGMAMTLLLRRVGAVAMAMARVPLWMPISMPMAIDWRLSRRRRRGIE